MKALIQKLVETPGPSGYESQVRAVVRAEVEPLADEVRVDNLGNLLARKGQGSPEGMRVMLSAHLDEIGVMVSHVDDNGFVRFFPVGGVFRPTLPGSRVRFLGGEIGVIGWERAGDWHKVPPLDQMYIDLGAQDRKSCPVRVGDVGVFERPFLDMGKRLAAKAMDDRIGVAVLIETLRQLQAQRIDSPHQIHFVFSVQEEVGPRGAKTAAFAIDPHLGLAVDVTDTGDTPKGERMEVRLGKGPAIKVRDSDSLSDPRVIQWMVQGAEKARIPYQLEVLEYGGTDASVMQLTRSGVPAGCLSIPCRYIHTPSEMVDYEDVQNAVRLLVELLKQPIIL
jgi:endoglucanase